MRRLLTGYVVTFNRRHGRSGRLFQNRYKSILCQEDSYLLELVRYIHLNWAIRELGISSAAVGKRLALSKSAVSRAAARGMQLIEKKSMTLEK